MTFYAPPPENDFAEYIRIYYEQCRHRFKGIEAIAGKWTFRDLIPGMSDFDTRFIVRDGMTAADWCAMSSAVGAAHRALCEMYPKWARNLEHLPGINLTWSELQSEISYYPEYQQWSFYQTEDSPRLEQAENWLARRAWDAKDEYFHLKKFCLYYGRYNRTIDPPVNMGIHESKYPLHSRIMHYFTPPVQSAICELERRHVAGKFEALELAENRFSELACWRKIREILQADYRNAEFYIESYLTALEDELEAALSHIAIKLRETITLFPNAARMNVDDWKKALRQTPVDPALLVLDSARFSRLMKGRLEFYANAPPHFDTTWLIRNELSRIGSGFFQVPFAQYWLLRTGKTVNDPLVILDELRGDLLNDWEIESTRAFARLSLANCETGKERARAREIAEIFDGFYHGLNKICHAVEKKSW